MGRDPATQEARGSSLVGRDPATQAENLEGGEGSRNAGGESRGSSLVGRDPATQAANLEGPRWWGGIPQRRRRI